MLFRSEVDACTRSLLRFGRLSFLSARAEPFAQAGHRLREVARRPDLMGRLRKCLLNERLWLVSADREVALREAYDAYGRWSFGHQPMLVMDQASEPGVAEADFLIALLARDERGVRDHPPGMIAWVAPLVDGMGILVVPARDEDRRRFAGGFMAEHRG